MFSNKNTNYMKLRTNLRLSVNRLKLLEKKKTELALKARREIADYIAIHKDDRARIRVEHIVREDYLVEAMEIIEMFCDLLLARFGLIEKMKELDPGLEEAIATILWATPRLSADVPEMKEISNQLSAKYGKEYAQMCRTNSFENVNEKVMHKLSPNAPPKLLVENYMIEISKAFNVAFEPDMAIMEGQNDNITNDLIDMTVEGKSNQNDKPGPPPDLMGGGGASGGIPPGWGGGYPPPPGGGYPPPGGGYPPPPGGGGGGGGYLTIPPGWPSAATGLSPGFTVTPAGAPAGAPDVRITPPSHPGSAASSMPMSPEFSQAADRPPPPLPSRPPNSKSPSPNTSQAGMKQDDDDCYSYVPSDSLRRILWSDDPPPPYDNNSQFPNSPIYNGQGGENGSSERSSVYVPVHPDVSPLPSVPADQIQSGRHNTDYQIQPESSAAGSNPPPDPRSSDIYLTVLPDLPAVPSDSVRTDVGEDVDFDDLTRRFEALKKK